MDNFIKTNKSRHYRCGRVHSDCSLADCPVGRAIPGMFHHNEKSNKDTFTHFVQSELTKLPGQ